MLNFDRRDDGNAVAGQTGPPAQVHGLCDFGNQRIKPLEPCEQLSLDKHARQRDREHVGTVIVLTLIECAGFDQRDNLAAVGHRSSDVDESSAGQFFGPGDGHRRGDLNGL